MTHKNFSFWLCTLFSGVVIGIASQRIPEANAQAKASKPYSYSFYCTEESLFHKQAIPSLQMQTSGYSFSYDVGSQHKIYKRFAENKPQK